MKRKILIDFDGTCVIDRSPQCGPEIKGASEVLRELVSQGHQLILFTTRKGQELKEARDWFRERGIMISKAQETKENGNLIIDNNCLGIPLTFNPAISEEYFLDWEGIREMLAKRKILQ